VLHASIEGAVKAITGAQAETGIPVVPRLTAADFAKDAAKAPTTPRSAESDGDGPPIVPRLTAADFARR
jgi:hypothetical protein